MNKKLLLYVYIISMQYKFLLKNYYKFLISVFLCSIYCYPSEFVDTVLMKVHKLY